MQHPFLLLVVFVVTVAASLAYQHWQATDGTMRGDVHVAESSGDDVGAETRGHDESSMHVIEGATSQGDSGLQSIFARLFGEDDDTARSFAEQVYAVPQYAPAEHAEWVDTFYTGLYSPEQPTEVAPPAEEVVPVISGRVLTQHGMPVEGIEVTAVFRDYLKTADSIAKRNAVGTQETKTNSDGFYAFRDLPAGIYMVATKESGSYAAARSEVRTGVKYADLVVTSQRVAAVTGVVTDPMGNEISDVRVMPLVKGIPEGAVSGRDGMFQFAVALQGQAKSFTVRFQRKGYREHRHRVTEDDWGEDGRLMLAVTMDPVYEFSSVSGSVKGADGSQVSDETVRLYSQSLQRNYQAVVNPAGEFRFPKVEIADDYQLFVRPAGPFRDYSETDLALNAGEIWRDLELEPLERGYRLRGRILDQRGKPVPDFTLTLRSKIASAQSLAVTSDAYGRYKVENVPEGELVFESSTMPFYTVEGLRLSGGEADRDLDLVVNRGNHKLLGKVVDRDGRPIASPKIFITASTTVNGLISQSSSSTSADYDGRFLFTDLGKGQHTVTVNAPGYQGARIRPTVGESKELVVELERSST